MGISKAQRLEGEKKEWRNKEKAVKRTKLTFQALRFEGI